MSKILTDLYNQELTSFNYKENLKLCKSYLKSLDAIKEPDQFTIEFKKLLKQRVENAENSAGRLYSYILSPPTRKYFKEGDVFTDRKNSILFLSMISSIETLNSSMKVFESCWQKLQSEGLIK